jgi:cation diffusion facilitator CzcD-associated flavoprotein CzcO
MRQEKLDASQQAKEKIDYVDYLAKCAKTFAGLEYQPTPMNTFDASEEEREAFWETLYQLGGFRFWQNNYQDFISNLEANHASYNFWARKTRARIQDPKKRDLLAPLVPPHPFGAKRPSLEQDFYEQFNKPNVHIVDTKSHPIVHLTPTGIATTDGKVHEVDIIAVATGFDAVTGGLLSLGLKDVNGVRLDKRWKDGMSTYLGMTVSGFPNMFLPYSLQAPTAFANGPTLIELQGDWIASIITKMENENIRSITATPDAESAWNGEVNTIANMTLLPLANSWYMGSNIPGKPVQSLNYIGGLPTYRDRCAKALDEDFFGFAKA